jgi:hypothetical protein
MFVYELLTKGYNVCKHKQFLIDIIEGSLNHVMPLTKKIARSQRNVS